MSGAINPAEELVLRKQIERVVRPVRAGKDLKLVMREELLSHLATVYLEELERQPDERAAIAAALERFGEPAVLTVELNTSVGFSERIAFRIDRWEDATNRALRYWFSRRDGESWFRLAFRSLFALALFNLAVFAGIPLLASVVLNGWPSDPTTFFLLPMLLLNVVAQAVTIIAMRRLLHTLDSHSQRSRWIWVCVQALLCSLFAGVWTVPVRWSLAMPLPSTKEVVDVAVSFAVGLSPFFVLGIWCMNHAKQFRKKLELWTKLDIDT
jgi:hypothetical protein